MLRDRALAPVGIAPATRTDTPSPIPAPASAPEAAVPPASPGTCPFTHQRGSCETSWSGPSPPHPGRLGVIAL